MHSIAIIGVGPKGLYCFERLIAQISVAHLKNPVHLHLIHRAPPFGCSPIYSVSLPDYILLNIGVGEINIWTNSDPPQVVPVAKDFVLWYNDKYKPQIPITGAEYLPRAFAGQYLTEGFQQLCKHLPKGITLHLHEGEALNFHSVNEHYEIEISGSDSKIFSIHCKHILLATGHSRAAPALWDTKMTEFASRHAGVNFIASPFPLQETLKAIQPQESIAMKGIGLTFIDAALELTEGRGGRFEETESGFLCYHPCGNEPVIFPFNRSGLPMAPKAVDQLPTLRPLYFFTPAKLQSILNEAKLSGSKVDFITNLLPLFKLEMQRAYYAVVMRDGKWISALEQCNSDAQMMQKLIENWHEAHPDAERFDPDLVLNPAEREDFVSGELWNFYVIELMKEEIALAQLGQLGSPLKSAIEIWLEVRYALSSILQFGGIHPASHKWLKQVFFPKLKRVVFGPPVKNMKKILALAEAGVIRFVSARQPVIETDDKTGRFVLTCKKNGNESIPVTTLIDARFPEVSIAEDASPLMQNLLKSGMIRLFTNHGTNGEAWQPGAIDMTPENQNIINRDGKVIEDISVVGIPTENNLVGNLTLAPGVFPSTWARQMVNHLKKAEAGVAEKG